MSAKDNSKPMGPDGGPSYTAAQPQSMSGGGGGASSQSDEGALMAMTGNAFAVMGVANVATAAKATATWNYIFAKFGATTSQDKLQVKVAFLHVCMVYGTSDQIRWQEENVDVVTAGGRRVPMHELMGIIGVGNAKLRRFAATEEVLAKKMFDANSKYADALRERGVRSGAAIGDEFVAVDFVGRTGALDPGVVASRVGVKSRAVARGEQRVDNNFTRQAEQASNVSLAVPKRPSFVGSGSGGMN